MYLRCDRNISKAAEALYIHRTTLIYRIERIRAISGLDLDSYPTRLYLSICFQLLTPAT